MRLIAVAAALLVGALTPSLYAAEPVGTEIVSVDEQSGRMAISVNVVGGDGRPITGLGAANFQVDLEGTPLPLSEVVTVSSNRQPAAVLLLVDVSGSMLGAPIQQARGAIQEFIRNLDPADQVATMTFSNQVGLLQDFTADRKVLSQAVSQLKPVGDTALFDAVIQAAAKIGAAPAGRRLVVLLSDGEATLGVEQRAASLDAARASGVGFASLGFGANLDRQYLGELAQATGGRFLEAPNADALRKAYIDLASAIKSQYTLIVTVPAGVDRTVPANLRVKVSLSAGSAEAVRLLNPLAGATAPPFDLGVGGIASGGKLEALTTVQPLPPAGVALARVEYWLDGQLLRVETAEPFTYDLDPGPLAAGKHLLEVVAIDSRGRRGEAQVLFSIGAAGGGLVSSRLLLTLLIIVGAVAASSYILRKKHTQIAAYAHRIKPWASRLPEPAGPIEGWPQRAAPRSAPVRRPKERLGRIVLMVEEAVRAGKLDAITEYAIQSAPLTFGTGPSCNIRVQDDDDGRIAVEEARLWLRGGRLVYHKLTTLSAMATEGVTSGWHFLESGEDLRIGPYRLVFQLEAEPEAEPDEPQGPQGGSDAGGPPQDHGMALREPHAAS